MLFIAGLTHNNIYGEMLEVKSNEGLDKFIYFLVTFHNHIQFPYHLHEHFNVFNELAVNLS